jgi:hypothetical protein
LAASPGKSGEGILGGVSFIIIDYLKTDQRYDTKLVLFTGDLKLLLFVFLCKKRVLLVFLGRNCKFHPVKPPFVNGTTYIIKIVLAGFTYKPS